jgi:hypothetical protein
MKKTLFTFLVLAVASCFAQVDSQYQSAATALEQLHSAANAQIASANQQSAALQTQLDAAGAVVSDLRAQIATWLATKTYSDLEWLTWKINCNAQVGGSGNGAGAQTIAPGASFTITPAAPVAGAANYFDCYYTADVAPDDAKKHFALTIPWTFPTATDSNASQGLEMEIRQSLTSGLQGVCALQMNFSGNQLRIYDHVRHWFATGVAMPHFTPGVTYTVTLECHRDDANNVVYDAITINNTRTPLTYTYPYWQDNWRPMMRVAGQLDGRGTGTPYTVKRGNTVFKESQ